MLRKYIKSKGCNNMEAFKKVYMEIREKSGACYVSSYCFSDFHPVTRDLRRFRMVLKAHPTGQKFVDFYYAVSPVIVSFCQKNPLFGFFFKVLTSPILRVCAYFARFPFCWTNTYPNFMGKVRQSNFYILLWVNIRSRGQLLKTYNKMRVLGWDFQEAKLLEGNI